MGLSVRSSRCATISMIIFGFLIFIPAGAFISFSLIFGHPILDWLKAKASSHLEIVLLFSWHLGYTSLLALITMITGCIGCCASGHRAHRDMCRIVTLFIFSMIVAGLSVYAIYDFSIMISATMLLIKLNGDTCTDGFCKSIFVAIEGSLLGLAILVFLLSSWAIICCLASFCCHTEVEPEPLPARQQMMGGQQGVMMQGSMVPMMRADTMHFMAQHNPTMVQAVPVVPSIQQVQVAPVNQELQQPSHVTPMQVIGSLVV